MNEKKQKDVDNWLKEMCNEKDKKKRKENIEFMKGLSF